MTSTKLPTIVIVPGLRDHMPEHWQTLLAEQLQAQGRAVQIVPQIASRAVVAAVAPGRVSNFGVPMCMGLTP